MSRYRDDWDDARRGRDDYDAGARRGEDDYRRSRRPVFTSREGDFEYEEGRGRRGRYDEDERAGFPVDSRRERRDEDDHYRRPDRDEGVYRHAPAEYSYDDRGRRDEGREEFPHPAARERRDPPRERRGATRSHVRCRDIMTRDVTVATRDTTLDAIARMMRDEDAGVIPVVDRAEPRVEGLADARPDTNRVQPNVVGNGRLVGLITDRDIVVRAVAEGRDARATRAEEIMTTDIHTAQPNDRVIEAIRKMGDKQVRRIPIVDRDGSLRGIISMADVALETEEDRELAEALEEISSGSSFWNRVFG